MTVTAIGARRRVTALLARGWTPGTLAAATGMPVTVFRCGPAALAALPPARLAEIGCVYEQLWDAPPPGGPAAVGAAKAHAMRAGYAPPMAYDDDLIDQPDGGPAPGWRRTGRATTPAADRADDVAFLRDHGGYMRATDAQLALRLGISKNTLSRALLRARQAGREAG